MQVYFHMMNMSSATKAYTRHEHACMGFAGLFSIDFFNAIDKCVGIYTYKRKVSENF